MVSLDRIHVIGSWYMSFNGGFKPRPKAFIKYFDEHGLKPKRLFFLGNKMVDLKLATALKNKLGCEVFKCLILRSGDISIGNRYADLVVNNLRKVLESINDFKPDLVMSDFDNTLVHSGHTMIESFIERLRFWEFYDKFRLLRYLYGIGSQLSIPLLNPKPYTGRHDDTRLFIKSLKQSLIIHTMSPELIVKQTLKKII